jgi:hypothetical protein
LKSDNLIVHLGKCTSDVLKNLIKQPKVRWRVAGTQVANPVLELVDSREQFVFARHPVTLTEQNEKPQQRRLGLARTARVHPANDLELNS